MHAFVLVCTVALVSLASARDILQDADPTSTLELVATNAGVVDPAVLNLNAAVTEPLVTEPSVAPMSTINPVPGSTDNPVPVGGEYCVDIPAECRQGYGGTDPCLQFGGVAPGAASKWFATHMKQVCVARGLPNGVPTPPSSVPLVCPTSIPPKTWTAPLPEGLPTSWCTWPGVSCASSYTTNTCPTTQIHPVVNLNPCASGVYIYSVHGLATDTVGTSWTERQAIWADGSGLFPTAPPQTGWGEAKFCVNPSCPPGSSRVPQVTFVAGSRYQIIVPCRVAGGSTAPITGTTYTCKLGLDTTRGSSWIRCNNPA